ncbi:AarF/UbiB family protein [Streptomyces sp. NPDC047017]|uniref:AarF/UbiB family protein n=1 Tax=Streptomyces sp. NPDC047017 TaxID=3155024 RepID=UPI0033DEAE47
MGSATGAQRQFPTGAAYAEALQHTQLCFHHPELRGAQPELTKLGLPRAVSGAFASVFSLTSVTSGQRYAIKCFTRHVPDQELRYQAISSRLAQLNPAELSQPWNLGFEYLPDAISVGQDRYPVLKMDWVEGVTLSSWLDDNHSHRFAVERLADRFEALIRDLAAHEIAHGDLQHGNLLVASDDTLRLVDYDGMYVPALAGMSGTERGHRNYQSPLRGNDDFGATLDRFSAWVIFLSLKAIATDPALWNGLHDPSGEFLLLTEEDFKNPGGSTRLQALLAHPDRMVSGLAGQVRSFACQPLDVLPPLAPAVTRQQTATTAASGISASGTASPPGTGGLPGWMTGHVPAQTAATPTASSDTAPAGFRTRGPLDVTTAVFWPFMLAATVLMVLAGFSVSLIGSGVPVLAAIALTAFARGRRTEQTQSRAFLAKLTNELAQLDDPAKAGEKLRKDRAKFDAAEAKRTAAYPRAQDRLTARYHGELKEAEKRRVRKQRDMDKKIDELSDELRRSLAKALTDKQSAYVRDQLSRRLIVQSPPHGIGPKLAARLAAAGIRTAADFTGYRPVQNTHYNSTGAALVLSSGRVIDVHGIGETKAIALDAWRKRLVTSAQARQPTALSTSERQLIEQGAARRQAQFGAQRRAVETETEALRVKARKQMEEDQERLRREHALACDQARQQQQEFSRRTIALQQDSALHRTLSETVEAAKLRQRGLSLARYLRFLYIGR